MSAKHTPGPWVVIDTDGGLEVTAESRDGHVPIVEIELGFNEPFEAEQKANARLIAAAPALVECLRLTLFDLDREDFKSESDRLIYIEKNIRAALSSAGVTP
jgi:uncharacterized protein (UPF0212 family)